MPHLRRRWPPDVRGAGPPRVRGHSRHLALLRLRSARAGAPRFAGRDPEHGARALYRRCAGHDEVQNRVERAERADSIADRSTDDGRADGGAVLRADAAADGGAVRCALALADDSAHPVAHDTACPVAHGARTDAAALPGVDACTD